MRSNLRLLVIAIFCIATISACGQSDQPLSVDAQFFNGLDRDVVAEILDNPTVRRIIDEEPEATTDSIAQGIAINFTVCRDALRVYEGWDNDGAAPDLDPLPVPIHPVEPLYSDWQDAYEELTAITTTGDLEQLRYWLTARGSCGIWIPAKPGDVDGYTVKDVIDSMS